MTGFSEHLFSTSVSKRFGEFVQTVFFGRFWPILTRLSESFVGRLEKMMGKCRSIMSHDES